MTTGKIIALTRQTFVGKVMSLLFNMLYVSHSFSSKEQASFIFMARVTIHSDFEPKKIKSLTVSIVSPSLFFPIFPNCFSTSLPWSDGTRCHDFSFMNVEFQVSFFTLLFHLMKRLFSSSSLSVIRVVSSAYPRLLVFLPAVLSPAWAS